MPDHVESALDVGCGLGDLARTIRTSQVDAIDSADMIERARIAGGLHAVVSHYVPSTRSDWALEVLALPANAAVGAVLAVQGKPHGHGMPVMNPSTTLPEIRAAAADLLPGSRVRRRLFWRYSLVWRKVH